MAGTGTAYPADAVSGAPTFTASQGRTSFAAAMGGATAARPLGGLSGVRPGTPTNTVTATSTTWTAASFGGYIDLHALATNGGYFFSFPTGGSGAIVAAVATARQDIMWVRIDDSNTSDGSGARQVVIDYTPNTLTPPARAFVIAIINVPATGGGAPTVTWVAPYTVAAGGILPVATAALLFAMTLPIGQHANVFADPNVNSNGDYVSTGSSWKLTAGSVRLYSQQHLDAAYSNLQAIGSVFYIPAYPVATFMTIDIAGLIGFSGSSAVSFGININGGGGTLNDAAGNTGVYCATAAQWYGYSRSSSMTVPANTASTVALSFSAASGNGHWRGGANVRVLFAGEF
jgi:hypothetical protein